MNKGLEPCLVFQKVQWKKYKGLFYNNEECCQSSGRSRHELNLIPDWIWRNTICLLQATTLCYVTLIACLQSKSGIRLNFYFIPILTLSIDCVAAEFDTALLIAVCRVSDGDCKATGDTSPMIWDYNQEEEEEGKKMINLSIFFKTQNTHRHSFNYAVCNRWW